MSDEPTKDANAVNLGAIATAFCCAIDDIVFGILYYYIGFVLLSNLYTNICSRSLSSAAAEPVK